MQGTPYFPSPWMEGLGSGQHAYGQAQSAELAAGTDGTPNTVPLWQLGPPQSSVDGPRPGQPNMQLAPRSLLPEFNEIVDMTPHQLYQVMDPKLCQRFWASINELDYGPYLEICDRQLNLRQAIVTEDRFGPIMQVTFHAPALLLFDPLLCAGCSTL